MADLSKSDSGANNQWRRVSLDAIDRLSDPSGQAETRRSNTRVALVMGAVVAAIFVVMAVLVGASWATSAAVVGVGLVMGGVVSATAYPLLNYLMGVFPASAYENARQQIMAGTSGHREGDR